MLTLTITTKRVVSVLALVVLGLNLANLAAQFYRYSSLIPRIDSNDDGRIELFDVGDENNIPTWYSSCALLLCAVLLAVIAADKKRKGDRYALHWGALSAIFVFLSLDEMASIHETAGPLIQKLLIERAFNTTGFLYYAWVIPAGVLVLIFVLAYVRFLVDLPARTRWLFLIAGAIFVGSALGLEMIEGRYEYLYGSPSATSTLTYAIWVGIEECLEMVSIVIFVYALMSYISEQLKELHLRVESGFHTDRPPDDPRLQPEKKGLY